MNGEKVFDLVCDCCGTAVNIAKSSKEKMFSPQKAMRWFAIATTAYLVGKEIYDMVKQAKSEEK